MTIASLSEVLQEAKKNNYAVAGLVVLGWEDARCYAETAEELKVPVILQAGPGCRANTPLPVLGKMFRVRKHLAKMAHKIFFKYGHKADFDMSGSPLVEIFDEYKWEDPR
jgi:fructose-bisphosphate aldolase class II